MDPGTDSQLRGEERAKKLVVFRFAAGFTEGEPRALHFPTPSQRTRRKTDSANVCGHTRRALSPVSDTPQRGEPEPMSTPEEDSFARNERIVSEEADADDDQSPGKAFTRAAGFASSIVG